MKLNRLILVFVLIGAFMAAMPTVAQNDTFIDPAVDYSFQLPEPRWKLTVKPSATSPNVEYVFGDRVDGHMTVRKVTVARDTILSDVMESEGRNKLQFLPGYVAGREENFAGKLRGSIFNYEFVAAGRNMAGRLYFLKANDTTVYLLRFTGQKDALRSLRNQTDSIARTFGVK